MSSFKSERLPPLDLTIFAKELKNTDSKYIPFAEQVESLAVNLKDDEILELAEKYMEIDNS